MYSYECVRCIIFCKCIDMGQIQDFVFTDESQLQVIATKNGHLISIHFNRCEFNDLHLESRVINQCMFT